ncbi:bifunctional diguanylate cyclase/phosphodiesterase [Blastococcus sp. CT_GayMR20]|uniref:putative bifunctional diguanylate cyclase/phosphodiesterase n=1 Tax=Blastococcus sp. CT_GayMR20 TaxID=2559609 RepID=UPI001430AE38|nr:bifunctional diguanylate cyclase/phosphodiesterase [Blastococcus sp. CT_GayMR20]
MCITGLIAGLLAIAAILGPLHAERTAYLPDVHLPWWAVALAFAATDVFVLNVQARRETQTVSLSEIPVVLGLFFAAPGALLAGRLIGCAAAMIVYRRSPPLKIAFNLSLVLAETTVTISVFLALAPAEPGVGPVSWGAAYAAAFIADLMGAVAISCVIAVRDGGVNVRSLLSGAGSLKVPALAVTVGLVSVIGLSAAPVSAWLLLAFGVLMLLAFRSYASLTERHMDLERLYRFSQAVAGSSELDEVMRNVLEEARELLRSERATAAFTGPDGQLLARVRLDAAGHLSRSEEPAGSEDAWLLRQVIDGGRPIVLPRSTRVPEARRWLQTYGMRDAIVVPLTGASGIVGALVVADRLGDVRTFEEDDALLLETVASHAAVALRNGELIGQLRHDSLHDALTGLPNRADVHRRLVTSLAPASDGPVDSLAVVVLDLDEFKQVNETLGHRQGDELLREVALRLERVVGAAGTVARLGADEFAVVLPAAKDPEHVVHLARRALRALERPVQLDGMPVGIGASAGIALAPQHATDADSLLKCADMAMQDAKSSTSRVRIYTPDLENDSPRRLTLVSDLRSAVHDGRIEVYVQPQAALADGRVTGVEALVRWHHASLGWIPPDEFIPVAERNGLIGPLTTRVLDASLAACSLWMDAGHELGVAVNLSTRSLLEDDLVRQVGLLLATHEVPADRLTLEITEGSVMVDPARAVAVLKDLRGLGVRLSVDDFGTGYSSLAYLQRLPVQEVKIDRSFVSDLGSAPENAAIVRAIIDLGRHLDLEVVAEGVEDAATWDLLAVLGCDLVQGWHLARAMPIDDLLPWLVARRPGSTTGATVS